ncbi:MAG: GNAT family N-acetyltransferase [Pseudomonadota bacterium]
MSFLFGCPGDVRLLHAQEWPKLLGHVRRLSAEAIYDRFHDDMSDDDLVQWARSTIYNDVFGLFVEGELRATIEVGYRGDRAECALTAEDGMRRYGAGRRLFGEACAHARDQGARTMAMLTVSRSNRDMRLMAARKGWTVSRSYARSIILPHAEPQNPLWLLRDLRWRTGPFAILGRLFAGRPAAEQD